MASRFSAFPLCRHTKTNGRLCQAPARTTSAYCHHHQKAHRRTTAAGPGLSTQVLYPLRNAGSIHEAAAMVLNGLAGNRIHPRIAGRMLLALQIASSNRKQDQ